MQRARAHRRLAGFGAFALLALVAEIFGRSLTVRLDLGRHVATPSYSGSNYYPFLLAGVKIGVALMLAALTWRFIKARAAARAARRLLHAVGARAERTPRVRIALSLGAGRSRTRSRRGSTSCRPTASASRPGSGRSCLRGCTPRRSPSSPCSPCSSRCSTAPSRAGSPTTSASQRKSRPWRGRCSPRRACARRRAAHTQRLRSAASSLRARLRVQASSRPGVAGRKPGLSVDSGGGNEYTHCN